MKLPVEMFNSDRNLCEGWNETFPPLKLAKKLLIWVSTRGEKKL